MSEIAGAILTILSAFPFAFGYIVGIAHRSIVWVWSYLVVGYRRGRYGNLE